MAGLQGRRVDPDPSRADTEVRHFLLSMNCHTKTPLTFPAWLCSSTESTCRPRSDFRRRGNNSKCLPAGERREQKSISFFYFNLNFPAENPAPPRCSALGRQTRGGDRTRLSSPAQCRGEARRLRTRRWLSTTPSRTRSGPSSWWARLALAGTS